MWSRAKPLFSVKSLPGWFLALWRPIYTLINAASNCDWVRQHSGVLKPMWTFVLEHGYWLTLLAGLLWLAYLVARSEHAKSHIAASPDKLFAPSVSVSRPEPSSFLFLGRSAA